MKTIRSLPVLFVLFIALAGVAWLVMQEQKTTHDWEVRKLRFQQAAARAEPLILAINAYTSATGHPPAALDDVSPAYLESLPSTGLQECNSFEYRSLMHKQGSIAWYDLGSRQGQPWSGKSRYDDGDPGHAILVFTLDMQEKITGAVIERMPKDHEPETFDSARWKAGENRLDMALARQQGEANSGRHYAIMVAVDNRQRLVACLLRRPPGICVGEIPCSASRVLLPKTVRTAC